MANFGKSALMYKYNWDLSVQRKHAQNYFHDDAIDRKNGHELLDFINRFMRVHGLTNLGSFQKMEWMICKYLPQDLYYRHEIEDWLRKNWGQKVYFY